jgi:hypothetical protein
MIEPVRIFNYINSDLGGKMTRKRTLISVLAVMLALWPAGVVAQKKKIEIERPEIKKPSKKLLEGAIVRGNKIEHEDTFCSIFVLFVSSWLFFVGEK